MEPNDRRPDVEVTITVRVGDTTNTFAASADTKSTGPHRVARGLVTGLADDATNWLAALRTGAGTRTNGGDSGYMSHGHSHT